MPFLLQIKHQSQSTKDNIIVSISITSMLHLPACL